MPTLAPTDDPNVKIPKGAKLAAARADELHKQMYSAGDDPKQEDPKKEAKPDGEKEGEKPVESAAPAETPAEPTAEAPKADGAPVTPPSKDPTPEEWEHRYHSMKGRFDRSEENVRALVRRVTQLEAELEAAKAAPVQPGGGGTGFTPQRLITPEEEADYGQEFLNVVGKKAQEVLGSEVTQLKEYIGKLEQQVTNLGGTLAQDARSKMYEALDKGCPDWEKINNDQRFFAWLQLPDTYSGAIRHNLLKAAFERHDAPRVLAFFNGFLAEEAAVAPAPSVEDPKPAAPAPDKVPLETLAAPGRAKSPAANHAPAEKPIISRDQITAFYAAVSAGKYRGREAEKDKLEKMIFEAQRDGRIR